MVKPKLKWEKQDIDKDDPLQHYIEYISQRVRISREKVVENLLNGNHRRSHSTSDIERYKKSTKMYIGRFEILVLRPPAKEKYQLEFWSKDSYYFPGYKVRYATLESAKAAAQRLVE